MAAAEAFKLAKGQIKEMVTAADGTLDYALLRLAVGPTTLQRMRLGVGNPTLESVCEATEALGFRVTFEKVRP